MGEKLTKAQQKLLNELAANSPLYVADNYKPGQRLLALGYAEARHLRFGSQMSITEAGRAALNTQEIAPND